LQEGKQNLGNERASWKKRGMASQKGNRSKKKLKNRAPERRAALKRRRIRRRKAAGK
jgi:hypothetical protein